jgi:hypothetical protein
VVCRPEVGLVGLDPGDKRGDGCWADRWCGAHRLWGQPRRCCTPGFATGVGVGVLQALALVQAGHAVSVASWWALGVPPAWALGWLVTSYVITTNIDEQFPNFGASGALVFGLLPGRCLPCCSARRPLDVGGRRRQSLDEHRSCGGRAPHCSPARLFLLARRFDYPEILRKPTDHVLPRPPQSGSACRTRGTGARPRRPRHRAEV